MTSAKHAPQKDALGHTQEVIWSVYEHGAWEGRGGDSANRGCTVEYSPQFRGGGGGRPELCRSPTRPRRARGCPRGSIGGIRGNP